MGAVGPVPRDDRPARRPAPHVIALRIRPPSPSVGVFRPGRPTARHTSQPFRRTARPHRNHPHRRRSRAMVTAGGGSIPPPSHGPHGVGGRISRWWGMRHRPRTEKTPVRTSCGRGSFRVPLTPPHLAFDTEDPAPPQSPSTARGPCTLACVFHADPAEARPGNAKVPALCGKLELAKVRVDSQNRHLASEA
jgi:hypothetical protein